MDDLGLGYEAAKQNNPMLVYCSIPAFTNEGLRDMPGYDLMMQGITGFLSITGEEGGPPVKMGVALLDIVAGLYATNAARLVNRDDLIADLSSTFVEGTVEHWVDALMGAGVPAGPIRSIDQVLESPEGRAMVVDVDDPLRGGLRLVRSPMSFDGSAMEATAPPALDQDGDEIRSWLGEQRVDRE